MLGQFEDIPLNDGAQPDLSCVLDKLVIGYCSTCRMVQRIGDSDLSGYYQGSTYSVVSSPFLNSFLNAVANHIVGLCETMQHDHIPRVLDIGCNTGEQLLAFRQLGCDVIGVEPSTSISTIAASCGLKVHNAAFGLDFASELLCNHGQMDVVISTFTLDQMDDPLGFLRGIANVLRPRVGLVVLEVHDIDVTYQTKEVALFDREHSIYPDCDSLGTLLNLAGLEIIETNFLPAALCRENSLLVIAKHATDLTGVIETNHQQRDFRGHLEAFQEIATGIDNLSRFIDDCIKCGIRLAGYGAGYRGIMYCSLIENSAGFRYFVDGNSSLHGSRMPKSQVPIYAPEHIQTDPVDYIVVFSHGYFQEIVSTCEALGYPKRALISLPEILTGDARQIVGIHAHGA
jgi:SAM-dependent methyltransferase